MEKPIILAIQNDETDPPHLAKIWLEEIGFSFQTLQPFTGESVPRVVPQKVSALMPLGGHMGALDDHIAPWLPDERALLADAVKLDIPIFAICLGTQLLAAANGGVVSRLEKNEVGVYSISPTEAAKDDPVFDIPTGTITTQWHEDYVSTLPSGAVRLATSELCPNQIYRIGGRTYGVQFHPEADTELTSWWEEHADNAFQNSGKSLVGKEFEDAEEVLKETWKPILQRWGRLVLADLIR